MRIKGIKFILVFYCVMAGAFSRAENPIRTKTITVMPYGLDHGLRQSMVNGIIQDDNGLIWMTTGDGLHCFDGKIFTSFRVQVNDVYNHPDNLLRGVANAGPGMLVVSSSVSVMYFNTGTGKFTISYRKEGSYPVLMEPAAGTEPWAWTHGLTFCIAGQDKMIPQELRFDPRNRPPENFLPGCAVKGSSGDYLIEGEAGFILLKAGKHDGSSFFSAKYHELPGFQAAAADRNGRIFILANGMISRHTGNGAFLDHFDTKLKEQSDMFIDSKGNFWLTTDRGNRQYLLEDGTLRELRFHYREGRHTDSLFAVVRTVFEDDHQNIWIGTDGEGVLLYAPGHRQLLRTDIGFTRCMAWFNNEIWAGTYKNGIWKMNADLSAARRVEPVSGFSDTYYLDMAADRYGRLWIAGNRGLTVYNRNGIQIFREEFNCKNAKLVLPPGDTAMLFTDTRLIRYRCKGDPLPLDSVGSIAVSSFIRTQETDWIGTRFGLYRCKRNTEYGKGNIFSDRNRITDHAVHALLMQGHQVWSATGNGLEVFDPDGKRVPMQGVFRELQNEVIYALLADDRGRVWFSGNHGIGCIDSAADMIVRFRSENNLQSLEFNSNAACKAPGGNLYFGGIRGINGFDPSWFTSGNSEGQVRLLSLVVSDTAYTGGIPPAGVRIDLGRQSPHISGRVFCSDYTDVGARLFSFFLEGYQQEWSKPSLNTEFNYRDLPPGSYRLLVKYSGPWHNWSKPGVILEVNLDPPFWKTAWFLVLIIMTAAVITALVVRKVNSVKYSRRILMLEQQNAIEKERLRIARDMHDDLGASLTRISILSELARQQQHDTGRSRQIIDQISGISSTVVDDMSEIIWAMNPRHDSLDCFTSYIRQYASSFLESAAIEGRFTFPDRVAPQPMSAELRRNLFLTVKEALNNVVKHSGATVVNVQLETGSGILRIVITDNGRGFEMTPRPVQGNGLVNMRKRIEELNGRFELSAHPGKGTKLDFSVVLTAGKMSP